MIFAYILAGLVGGIIGGMGMGGGTLLIPILTVFLGIEQHLAQAVNLLVFIPTAVTAIIIHAKHKLIDYKISLRVAIPAIITAIFASIIVGRIESRVLKIIFAGFLIFIGIIELYKAVVSVLKKKKPILKNKNQFRKSNNNIKMKFFVKS